MKSNDKTTVAVRSDDVGLVFALAIESGGLEDRMSSLMAVKGPPFRVRHGRLAGRDVVVFASGPGREAAARATETLIAGHRPRLVISAGFAGGLAPDVRRGDLVMARSIADETGKRLAIELEADQQLLDATPGLHVGRLLTVDRIVRTTAEKRQLGEAHQVVAVDMESLAVAEVCQREQTAFLAARVISDGVDDELPRDIERLLRAKTTMRRLGAVTGTIFRRPSSVKDLWKLKEGAILASDRLAKLLEVLISRTAL